jgi:1-deoxy-D-xylulose-5-phosphate synthase
VPTAAKPEFTLGVDLKKTFSYSPGLLSGIQGPEQLSRLSMGQMESLAEEIRHLLIESVAKTGGHLASNLGVVELTLALHRTYDSPSDKLVWDVGHQSYVHKMLTGRLNRMDTLRKRGGLSGFPKREESPHDAFNTGHSSTSVSAALGLARARDLLHQDHHVVAIIGDGALSGGMALEALNDAGMARTNLLVVLNDNGMSIARNVGGLSRYLSLLRTRPGYYKTREFAERLTERLPGGRFIRRSLRRLKTVLKSFLVPSLFFEDLGFRYFGPVDGHDMKDLTALLEHVRTMQGPVLLHVRTQKGRGYRFAEKNPDVFHGMAPFEVETGSPIRCHTGTWSELFGNAMTMLADELPDLVAITAGMPDGTGLVPMRTKYPSRVFDVGIAEQHAVTLAAGLAAGGVRPVAALYSTFLQRAYDQVLHDVCLQNLPVVFAVDRAGVVGDDGETHQGTYDLSYLGTMPNLTILAPASGPELPAMLRYALAARNPVAIRYPRGCADSVPSAEAPMEAGKAVLLREGSDAAIVAVGVMVAEALAAADALEMEGLSCSVLHARFVKPFDGEAIRRLALKTGRIVTVEDNVRSGGFGAGVAQWLMEQNIPCIVRNVGFPDEPIAQGTRPQMLSQYGLDALGIAREVCGTMPGRGCPGEEKA